MNKLKPFGICTGAVAAVIAAIQTICAQLSVSFDVNIVISVVSAVLTILVFLGVIKKDSDKSDFKQIYEETEQKIKDELHKKED